MSRQLTLDEWLVHYLQDNEKYKQAAKFLLCIYKICDRIVLQDNTPLMKKLYKLLDFSKSKDCSTKQRDFINFFRQAIFFNSQKVLKVQNTEAVELNCASNLHRKNHYLLKMLLSTADKILITSDKRLIEQIRNCRELDILVYEVNKFIEQYIGQCKNHNNL